MAKTLVITGGTRGIGKACVYRFAKEGIDVAFTYNSNKDIANEICQDLMQQYNIKAKAYQFDILEPESAKELFNQIDQDFDRIDYFISNAMIYGRAIVGGYNKFIKLKPKGLNNIYTATVDTFVTCSQQAAKRMQKLGKGAIVSLSSTGNLVYIQNYAGHGSNKAAIEAMVRYAATELGEFGIRVNAVSGGPIDTDALKAFTNYKEVKQKTIQLSPLKRMGTPQDLANACYFLCSDEASWITGTTLIVDGGTTFNKK
jgi:7-alpha-hydroxysteroid dehydrogenase